MSILSGLIPLVVSLALTTETVTNITPSFVAPKNTFTASSVEQQDNIPVSKKLIQSIKLNNSNIYSKHNLINSNFHGRYKVASKKGKITKLYVTLKDGDVICVGSKTVLNYLEFLEEALGIKPTLVSQNSKWTKYRLIDNTKTMYIDFICTTKKDKNNLSRIAQINFVRLK